MLKKNIFFTSIMNILTISYFRKLILEYYEESIIEQLRQKNPNSFVYIVSANNDASANNGNPYIDKFTYNSSSPTEYSAEAVTTIDFSKHSIIVYNAESTDKNYAETGYTGDVGSDGALGLNGSSY